MDESQEIEDIFEESTENEGDLDDLTVQEQVWLSQSTPQWSETDRNSVETDRDQPHGPVNGWNRSFNNSTGNDGNRRRTRRVESVVVRPEIHNPPPNFRRRQRVRFMESDDEPYLTCPSEGELDVYEPSYSRSAVPSVVQPRASREGGETHRGAGASEVDRKSKHRTRKRRGEGPHEGGESPNELEVEIVEEPRRHRKHTAKYLGTDEELCGSVASRSRRQSSSSSSSSSSSNDEDSRREENKSSRKNRSDRPAYFRSSDSKTSMAHRGRKREESLSVSPHEHRSRHSIGMCHRMKQVNAQLSVNHPHLHQNPAESSILRPMLNWGGSMGPPAWLPF